MLVRTCIAVVAFLGGSLLAAPAYAAPAADLRADVNRDGALSAADDAAEDQWTKARGAVVLPNLDDDQARCPKKLPNGKRIPDDALPTCQDASDAVVNGPADLADLARVRVQPVVGLPSSAQVTLTAGPRLRVYVHRGSSWVALPASGKLTAAEARGGVELAVEATDVVRDLAVWNGLSDLTLKIVSGGATTTDRVRVRVAPLLFQHDLMTVRRLMVSDNGAEPLVAGPGLGGRRDILGRPMTRVRAADPGEEAFRRDLRKGLDGAGLTQPFIEHPTGGDIWVQDQFEPAYASMPAVGGGGAEQRIRIYVRSANLSRSSGEEGRPLREGGRNVFLKYRGSNTAGVQQYDPRRVTDPNAWESDTFNSTGNFGAVPPYSHAGKAYPAGRMVYGSIGRWSPDSSFAKLLQAQGFQRPIVLDTSWLLVGHIDEFMSILPAKTKRGWILAVADPVLGEKLLNDLVARGKGGTRMFNGVPEGYLDNPDLTVAQALREPRVRGANRIAERGIDRALAKLRAETGITDREIVRVPALFDQFDGLHGRTFAYLPGVANGIGTGTSTYLAPKQHGPIDGGKDVFQRVTETALAKHGVRVAWVEDWAYAHVGLGEIHCVTNAERDLTKTKPWWNERG